MNDLINGIIYNSNDPIQQANEQFIMNIQDSQALRNAQLQQSQAISNQQNVYTANYIRDQIYQMSNQNPRHSTIIRNMNSDSYELRYIPEATKIPINWGKYIRIVLLFLPVLSLLTLWLL